jgi:hypothetical protein
VHHFDTAEELRLELIEFADWYNTHWLVAPSPQDTRSGQG